MTIKLSFSENILDINDVINVRSYGAPGSCELGGATWLEAGVAPYDSLLAVLRFIYRLVQRKLPRHRMWVLIASPAWQPDTRITRYHKLWGALKARGIEISHACEASEYVVASNEGVKFFGSICISELSLPSVAKALLAEKSAYILSCSGQSTMEQLVETGWRGELGHDMALIESVTKSDSLLFKVLGEFDDRERGLVGIGKPNLLRDFCN
ncbi:hypothetical protein ACFFTM_02505 [Pseudoduganella plicata]|uniref:Glycosyltransferase n=1 Tax=Pseudoduganella plicata TaxID=321984 RepID=A0A4P7BF16_9BURK|nr:hypothetical protein [Pseudoduganella plicata]QBQ36870.1 hypothetical protein E1742_12345 [Pseudoduganella plicata]GGY72029.1 hypothetical protein GCM10007388_00010 [Pseudoduganella plicata]